MRGRLVRRPEGHRRRQGERRRLDRAADKPAAEQKAPEAANTKAVAPTQKAVDDKVYKEQAQKVVDDKEAYKEQLRKIREGA